MMNNAVRYFIHKINDISNCYMVETGLWYHKDNSPQLLHRLYRLCNIEKYKTSHALEGRKELAPLFKWVAVSYAEGSIEKHLNTADFIEVDVDYLKLLTSYEV